MTQLWSVRIYKEGDQPGILELMKSSSAKRTSEHWLWEYENNPFGYHIGVAEHNGQIVGHMALVPTYMKVGRKTIMGSQAVDLLVHPKFRRQGMFLALGTMLMNEARKKQIDITYGFPNAPAHSGHLKYGWFDICEVPQLIKAMNIDKVVDILGKGRTIRLLNKYRISRNFMKIILHIILSTVNFFSRIWYGIPNNRDLANVKISIIESFDDRIDDFWKKVSSDYNIAVARNKEYLNWRYFRKPNAEYTVILAEKDEEILGYIVLRTISKENLKLGYIVDILASLDGKVIIQSLILRSIERFRKENVDSIFCWMLNNNLSASTYYKVLRCNGFLLTSSNPLIARVNSQELSKKFVGDSTKWYITIGDSDHV